MLVCLSIFLFKTLEDTGVEGGEEMNEKNGPVQAGEHNIVLKFSQTEGHVTRSNLSLQLAMQFFAEKNIAGSS